MFSKKQQSPLPAWTIKADMLHTLVLKLTWAPGLKVKINELLNNI